MFGSKRGRVWYTHALSGAEFPSSDYGEGFYSNNSRLMLEYFSD